MCNNDRADPASRAEEDKALQALFEENERLKRALQRARVEAVAMAQQRDALAQRLVARDEGLALSVRELRHDLRTPISALLGLAQLLTDGVDGSLGSEQTKQVRLIQRCSRSLAGLVEQRLRSELLRGESDRQAP